MTGESIKVASQPGLLMVLTRNITIVLVPDDSTHLRKACVSSYTRKLLAVRCLGNGHGIGSLSKSPDQVVILPNSDT